MNQSAQSTASAQPATWAESLSLFLAKERSVGAVRIAPETQTVSVATVGTVDLERLRAKLESVIQLHRADIEAGMALGPTGMVGVSLRRDGAAAVLEREVCPTAPRFWRWREFAWPEAEDEAEAQAEEDEWKLLGASAAVCGLLASAAFLLERFAGVDPLWVVGLYLAAMAAGGWDAARDVAHGLPRGEIDIHFLMLAVAIGASAIGAYGEGALLLFLFSLSGALEAFAMHRTRREIGSLLKAAPKQATRLRSNGEPEVIDVAAIQRGDRLLTRPDEIFPCDGEVLKGRSAVDESNLTGEATPVEKSPGDEVYSGTLNLWGTVELRATKLAAQSTLQKIIQLIRKAQKMKAPSQRFTDRFGAGYTIFALGLCAAMFLVWWLALDLPAFRNEPDRFSAFYRAMTLLVVLSPCALVLSIPSAILAAIAWGARHGILFRGGVAIEKLAEVQVVALDKTGTLTTGELAVASVESFPAGREREVLEAAVALEEHSRHPIARAILRHGRAQGIRGEEAGEVQQLAGKGIRGKFREASVLLGRRELLEAGPFQQWIESVPQEAGQMTEVWVLYRELLGRVLLRDEPRAASRGVLAEMRAMGLRPVMLTGDRRQSAEAMAREIGIEEVRAGLLPEGKVEAIRELGANGVKVAMVGDGVNDAPSLAAAYVAVAMGARGSDAALEQSEVVLVNDRIENFLAAFRLSQRARKIIRQNLVISLGTIALMAVFASLGAVPLSLGVFAHEGSTVVVCLNSLRLMFGRR
jgi:Zn2+/Cd2+-exporting ATPase